MRLNKGDLFNETFRVSQEIQTGFMDLFKDRNPLHTVDTFAVDHGFSGVVMHGNILNGFLSYFIGERLPVKGVVIHSQEIQYANPCYLNEQLSFKAEIIETYESVNAVEFRYEFRNADLKMIAKGKFQIGLLK